MMRKIIAATTLAMSPMLLHAQAPAPVQSQTSNSVRVSKLVKPDRVLSSNNADSYNTHAISIGRISSGIVAPKLIHTSEIAWTGNNYSTEKVLVVGMTIDTAGKPKDLKIIQSTDPMFDENVLESVSQYRFTPGTLDNEPVATPLYLHVVVRRPSYY